MTLRIVPASRANVGDYIARVHRHHKPPTGDLFRLAVVDDSGLVRGVASVGRPVAPKLQDGWTFEVNRVATDGAFNACSKLYGAARTVAFTLGYRRGFTYTLPSEGGASLRGAGWTCDGDVERSALGWKSREGRADVVIPVKTRWSCVNPGAFGGVVAWPEAEPDPQAPLFRVPA